MPDLKAQYKTIREEIRSAVDKVLESQYFINGPEVKQLEDAVAAYSRCKRAIGVSSGTDQLNHVAKSIIGFYDKT